MCFIAPQKNSGELTTPAEPLVSWRGGLDPNEQPIALYGYGGKLTVWI